MSGEHRILLEVVQREDGVYISGPAGEWVEVPCQYFALCDRHAATTVPHPVLGDVPICQRCKDRYDSMAATP